MIDHLIELMLHRRREQQRTDVHERRRRIRVQGLRFALR